MRTGRTPKARQWRGYARIRLVVGGRAVYKLLGKWGEHRQRELDAISWWIEQVKNGAIIPVRGVVGSG